MFAPQYRIMRHPELAEVFVRELASRAKTNDRSRRRMEAGIHKRLRLAFNGKSNIFLGKPTKFLTRSLPRPTAVVLVGLPRSVKPHLSKLRCGSASLTQDDSLLVYAPQTRIGGCVQNLHDTNIEIWERHLAAESGYVLKIYTAQTPRCGSADSAPAPCRLAAFFIFSFSFLIDSLAQMWYNKPAKQTK